MGVSIPLRGMPRTPSARAAPLHWHLLLPSPPCTSLATAVIVPHAVLATSDHPVNRIGIATMRRKKTPPRWAYHDWTRRAPIFCDRRVRPSHVTESPSHRLFAAIRVYIRLDTVSPIAIKSAFPFHSLLEAAVITGAGVSGVRFQNCTVLPAAGSQQHKHTSGWEGGRTCFTNGKAPQADWSLVVSANDVISHRPTPPWAPLPMVSVSALCDSRN